ncbi:ribose 5-phosphate isomerase B [Paenilisteria rocourtiae]|uniref:Ribose-5-phosphate isomerase n=1 Tax=Listeria rocourtiae TaxID=647910 RepID=A0A4R6ZE05_9LIST|nr:ribose 5-phosphate isomerase B [Listeria rocourtiae]EUJ47999.1 ribose 5-phosphate isomerase B [Listeria rocourtiae FSL F6-920]TDR50401.1 ribose-5-phosphate isomerase [Listeria rocourtiae]
MRIGIGADHNAFGMKEALRQYIKDSGNEVVDFGCFSEDEVDYPDIAFQVGTAIQTGVVERGILVCGTGIGMSIAANKVPGIRSAQCHDVYSAERAQLSNDAQIITLGAKVIGLELAKKIVDAYLDVTFAGGQSKRKIDQISNQEKAYLGSVKG